MTLADPNIITHIADICEIPTLGCLISTCKNFNRIVEDHYERLATDAQQGTWTRTVRGNNSVYFSRQSDAYGGNNVEVIITNVHTRGEAFIKVAKKYPWIILEHNIFDTRKKLAILITDDDKICLTPYDKDIMVALSKKFPQYFSKDESCALLDADDFVDILYDLKQFIVDEELFNCGDCFQDWVYTIETINGSINNRYIHTQRYEYDYNIKYHVATSSSTLMKDSLGITHNITPGCHVYVPETEAGQSIMHEEHLWVEYTKDFKIIS